VLVAERALGTDQGRKYVLGVDDQEVVQYRPVEVGPLEDDGLRVILDGLRGDERVVVSGLQQVRPRMAVEVEEAPAAGAAPDPPADAPSPPPPAGR
jgi:multidrug efflux pump subunit AcrA (membrane-fusion protein)